MNLLLLFYENVSVASVLMCAVIMGKWKSNEQRAKKVVSDSPGLVDFVILFLTCPMGK